MPTAGDPVGLTDWLLRICPGGLPACSLLGRAGRSLTYLRAQRAAWRLIISEIIAYRYDIAL